MRTDGASKELISRMEDIDMAFNYYIFLVDVFQKQQCKHRILKRQIVNNVYTKTNKMQIPLLNMEALSLSATEMLNLTNY